MGYGIGWAQTVVLLAFFTFVSPELVAKGFIKTPEDFPVVGEVEPFLIDNVYKDKDVEKLSDIVSTPKFRDLITRHSLKLFGGPVVGAVTEESAKIWVRTVEKANVKVKVLGIPGSEHGKVYGPVRTKIETDLTAVIELTGLEPGTKYSYDVMLDTSSVLGGDLPAFRTFPAKGDVKNVTVGFGGGIRYNHKNEKIWEVLHGRNLDAFLMLGDNVYHDKKDSPSGQRVHYYRRQLRPEYKAFSASTPVFAIWDDHDFCGNDCGGGSDAEGPEWKIKTWKVFRENWVNPAYGGGEESRGVWYDFSLGTVDFFMLDSRYYRAGNTMLGPEQKAWLKERLKQSQAVFKVIASPVPWAFAAKGGSKDPWSGFKEERTEIFDFLADENIPGVILISADRHRHDAWKIDRPNGYPLYEFMSSRMTNNHSHGCIQDEEVLYCTGGLAFGILDFDLSKSDPEMTYRIHDIDDQERHAITVKRSELGPWSPTTLLPNMEEVKNQKGSRYAPFLNDALRDIKTGNRIKVFNLSGKVLWKRKYQPNSWKKILSDLESIKPGAYFLDIDTFKGKVLRQIVVP